MEISAKTVMQLREMTGAGMMDCKEALRQAQGDMAEAEKVLRKQDKVKAAKKAGRSANQGLVQAYVHAGGRIGVLVEINCETDFAAASDDFKDLAKDIAMHIAAADPRFLARDEVTKEILDGEREIYRAQVANLGKKPPEVIEKIVEGKLASFYSETCLLDQAFVKDTTLSVQARIEATIAKIGENVRVRRFARFKLGEAASAAKPSAESPAAESRA